ncbi:hypothetical protein BH09ACT6_BH09ACT6_10750 [soil metagenome]
MAEVDAAAAGGVDASGAVRAGVGVIAVAAGSAQVDARAGTVTVRYFAAAKAAAGVGEEVRSLAGAVASTAGDAGAGTSAPGCSIQALLDGTPFGSAPVFARSTFLLNGETTTDRATIVRDGDTLDVLPPFAGG